MPCPRQIDGYGQCNDKYCPYCGINAMNPPTAPKAEPGKPSWMADLLTNIGANTDEELLSYLNNLANQIAKQGKNFALSAKIRDVLENPTSGPAKYKALMNSARFTIICQLLGKLAQDCMSCADGLMMEAMGDVPKYEPRLAAPDNGFGSFCMDSLDDLHQHFEAAGPFKKQHFNNPVIKPKKIIIDP